MVGGVYSEEQTWSTGFGRLQPLRFHAHAFPPQRTAPFLVQPVVGRFEGDVRKHALKGNSDRRPKRAVACCIGVPAVKN